MSLMDDRESSPREAHQSDEGFCGESIIPASAHELRSLLLLVMNSITDPCAFRHATAIALMSSLARELLRS